MNIEEAVEQVKLNCEISDAKNWGFYTLCVLLLKCRDLYRWERKIEPWKSIDNQDLLDWISEKERRWKALAGEKFRDIKIEGNSYSIFDVEGVNRVLSPKGFIYGAGYAASLRHSFFLGELEEMRRENGHALYVVGRELARDLATSPAMLQESSIFVRKEPARSFLWSKVEEFKTTKKVSLRHAFEDYGMDAQAVLEAEPESIKGEIDRISEEELESYVRHEIGEASDRVFPERHWLELVEFFPDTNVERFARSIKDVLGDTNEKGMLKYIIQNEKRGSLSFYVSNLSGLRDAIFPEMKKAYALFRNTGDWSIVENARKAGYRNAQIYAKKLVRMYLTGKKKKEECKRRIEEELIDKLKVGSKSEVSYI